MNSENPLIALCHRIIATRAGHANSIRSEIGRASQHVWPARSPMVPSRPGLLHGNADRGLPIFDAGTHLEPFANFYPYVSRTGYVDQNRHRTNPRGDTGFGAPLVQSHPSPIPAPLRIASFAPLVQTFLSTCMCAPSTNPTSCHCPCKACLRS